MEALEMERPMTEWNDDRLDELNERVKEGFAKVDKRFEQVATRESVADLKGSFGEPNERLNRLDVRMGRLYWAFVVLVVMLAGNLIAHSA